MIVPPYCGSPNFSHQSPVVDVGAVVVVVPEVVVAVVVVVAVDVIVVVVVVGVCVPQDASISATSIMQLMKATNTFGFTYFPP